MCENTDYIENFENLLKKESVKNNLLIYNDNYSNSVNKKVSNITCHPENVLQNVSSQIVAIQRADCFNYDKSMRKNLEKYKTSRFLTADMLSAEETVTYEKTSKFETQCVTDTQLVNLVYGAEALAERGLTQEFEIPFHPVETTENISYKQDYTHSICLRYENNSKDGDTIEHKYDSDKENIVNKNQIGTDYISVTGLYKHEDVDCKNSNIIGDFETQIVDMDSNLQCKIKDEEIVHSSVRKSDLDANSEILNTPIDIEINTMNQLKEDAKLSLSPILKTNSRRTSSASLVFDLETFENFERIALPIIVNNQDVEMARNIINSQIIGKELQMQGQTKPYFREYVHSLTSSAENKEGHLNNVDKISTAVKESPNEEIKAVYENIDDEILFSSDDEKDNKENGDLPFTCAIETSFYDQPNVLDKTMYVGFQTASNKSIQICTDSFTRAKSMLQNVKNTIINEPSLTELVELCDNVTNNVKIVDDYKLTKDVIGVEAKINSDVEVDNKATNAKIETKLNTKDAEFNFEGFKTANNKVITLSEKALSRCRRVFQDIDLTNNFDKETSINLNSNNTFVVKGDEFNDIFLQEFEDIEMTEKVIETNKKYFTGFRTASDKNIALSDDAVAKVKGIFHDIDFTEKFDEKNIEDVLCNDQNNVNISAAPAFEGFKTANNEVVHISEDSLPKTKNMFEDIELGDLSKVVDYTNLENAVKPLYYDGPSTSKATFVGFKTANNKEIKISEQLLAKTKNIFQDIDEDSSIFESKTPKFKGFKSASNKKVNILEVALAESKQVSQYLQIEEIVCKNKSKDDQVVCPANNNDIGLKINIAREKNSSDSVNDGTCSKFQGFKTASNKEVKVSLEALEKTKNVFQDIVASDNIEFKIKQPNLQEFKLVYSKPIHITEDERNRDMLYSDLKNRNENNAHKVTDAVKPIFQGFQTASNKIVHISDEALAKSKKLLQDVVFEENELSYRHCDKNDHKLPFKGFHTASNKEVKVSEHAILKSRQIFEDMDADINDKLSKPKTTDEIVISSDILLKDEVYKDSKDIGLSFSFKTTNNKKIKISHEALTESKKLFADFNETEFIPDNKGETNAEARITRNKNSGDINIENMIDTQVVNNFEMTLCTEDFGTTPRQEKRSASPILSCPKAKKRKLFVTPCRIHTETSNTVVDNNKPIESAAHKMEFRNNYKKIKKYKLSDLVKLEKDLKKEVSMEAAIPNLSFDNLLQYEFPAERNNLTAVKMTTDSLKIIFLDSVNKKIIPDGWIENHLRLILWKCFSYELKFPHTMKGICTVRNVIDQLKYRYDKELYNVERPALRKILEKDDLSTKSIVLCVVQIYEDSEKVNSVTNLASNIELMLSDGWYCIKACTDKMLAKLVYDKKISIGVKLVTHGAELLNCEQGVSPWEDTSSVRLKLYGNSTRRARWDCRLGYHGNGAILTSLSSVKVDGGKISKLRLFVTRVYPALYVEKFEDGSTVTRSERLEHIHQMKYEAERQLALEKLYEEVEKEFFEESQDSDVSDGDKRRFNSGSQLAKMIGKDPGEFEAPLTSSQMAVFQEHVNKRHERFLQRLQARVQERAPTRNVVPLRKIRVVGVREGEREGESGVAVTKGLISVWRSNEAILDVVKEGEWIDVLNVIPTAFRYSEIQMSAGRQSLFIKSKKKYTEKFNPHVAPLKRTFYPIKNLNQNPFMNTDYNEIDTAGFIFLIDPSIKDFNSIKHQFQNVYLADADKNVICLIFWGGLKKFGFENALDTGQIVACINLQKRAGNTKKNISQYRVTEFSYFTKTPKYDDCRKGADELMKHFAGIDKNKFITDCIAIKNNYSAVRLRNENISPYKFFNADLNLSKNKVFVESPLAQKVSDEFNLSGLDFESTFKQTDTQYMSPKILLRKKRVIEKMAKLKMYGEPPPLASIHIINKTKDVVNSYKSPLIQKNVSVTSDKMLETPKNALQHNSPISHSNCLNPLTIRTDIAMSENTMHSSVTKNGQSSPVLNTGKKNIKPTKLIFSNKPEAENNIDNFSEDFECSPPLSLD